MREGHQSAQRINNSLTGDPLLLQRVDASQLEAQVHVVPGRIEEQDEEEQDDEEPMNLRDLIALSLCWLASCALVGLAFYGATKLAEAMR